MSLFFTQKIHRPRLLVKSAIVIFSLFIIGCGGTTPPKATTPKETVFHQDSTVYFSKRKASISLRASFSNKITVNNSETNPEQEPLPVQPLIQGYKFQFRSIKPDNIFIDQLSIIAGGKKIVIADAGFFVPSNQGVTLNLSLADTLFIHQKNDAILRFKADGVSELMSINGHKMNAFTLPQ